MILITGATGIVGSHIAIQLLKESRAVRLLVRESSDRSAIDQLLRFHGLEDKFEYVEGDINDPLSIDAAFQGVDQVYHCAALVHFGSGKKDELFQANVIGTRNIADQCLIHQKKLCYVSSTAAVGSEVINGAIREESAWDISDDRSDYSLSKREAEMEVFRAIVEGLDAVVVNPCLIIGPGNWGNSSTSVILTAMRGLLFYPSGSNAFVDARDVAEMSIALTNSEAEQSGRHLLIGENLSFKKFFVLACGLAGSRAPEFHVPRWLVLSLANVIKLFEGFGVWPFKLNSSSLESACRITVFSNDKIKSKGMRFRSISDSLEYTLKVYKQSLSKR